MSMNQEEYRAGLEKDVEANMSAQQFMQSAPGQFFNDYRIKQINKLIKKLKSHECNDGVCMGIKREIEALEGWDKHLSVTEAKGKVAQEKLNELEERSDKPNGESA